MHRCILLIAVAAAAMSPRTASGCSTFCLVREATVVFGRNNDFTSLEGRIHVNRRGLEKTAFSTNPAAHWVSRYGSVTHTQWGLEFPCGGMNEAGLVVENMSLNGSAYPSNNLPALIELQWIQYQLDCSASIDDVLANDARVRITADSTPLHFMVTDHTGRTAIIEFLGGKRIVYTGNTLPVAALTNDSYADSLNYEAGTQEKKTSSLSRFVRAAAAVRQFNASGAPDPVAYGFGILADVTQPNLTLWSVVYDVTNRRMHFRSKTATAIKTIRFEAVDFRSTTAPVMLNINTPATGDVVPADPYTRADNLALLLKVGRETSMTANVTTSYWEQRAAYPETVRAILPPIIQSHPGSMTTAPGGTAQFSVSATGEGELTYQWLKDGSPVEGATGATLTIPAVRASDAGDFTVQVGNRGDTVQSRFARLVVAIPVASSLSNLSVRSSAGVDGQPLILGLSTRGGTAALLLRAIGPTLKPFGVPNAVDDCRIDVHEFRDGQDRIAASNDNWGAIAAERDRLIQGSIAVGAFPLPVESRDAALIVNVDGVRTVHAAPVPVTSGGVVLAEAYALPADPNAQLINLSCRNTIGPATGPLIAGLLIGGNTPMRLLIRGVGPGLAGLGVGNVLPRPRLELHAMAGGRDTIVAVNERWEQEPGAVEAAQATGAFALPAGSRDTALVLTVPAGAYSAVLSSSDGSTGAVLIEIYRL